jgi:hypothetical protein
MDLAGTSQVMVYADNYTLDKHKCHNEEGGSKASRE